jgi:hypothetical protein
MAAWRRRTVQTLCKEDRYLAQIDGRTRGKTFVQGEFRGNRKNNLLSSMKSSYWLDLGTVTWRELSECSLPMLIQQTFRDRLDLQIPDESHWHRRRFAPQPRGQPIATISRSVPRAFLALLVAKRLC